MCSSNSLWFTNVALKSWVEEYEVVSQLWERQARNYLLLMGNCYFSVGWFTQQIASHHWELITQPKACTIKQAFPDGLSVA